MPRTGSPGRGMGVFSMLVQAQMADVRQAGQSSLECWRCSDWSCKGDIAFNGARDAARVSARPGRSVRDSGPGRTQTQPQIGRAHV